MECDLDKKSLTFAFCLGLALTLLVPHWKMVYFAPFLIMAMYQKSLTTCLFFGIGCGTLLDLLSAYSFFGLHAAAYCGTILILHPQRRHVFADSVTTLPIMTALFSSISTAFLALLLDLLDIADVFSWPWVTTDLIIFPVGDAALSFALYIFPALIFGKRRRGATEYFLAKQK